jgi:GH35 family endo-1,4-beta-xylanase
MQRLQNRSEIKLLAAALCSAATITLGIAGESPSFYDPAADPIPYTPANNAFGPNYEIPDDPWKTEADQRIDTHRKADLKIVVVNSEGKPLNNIPVHIELKRHDFSWGAILSSDFLNLDHGKILTSYFLKYFNSTGSGMGFKPKPCPIAPCGKTKASTNFYALEKQMKWFKKHNIPVRGHTLAWEGKRFLSKEMSDMLNNPDWSDEEKGQRMFAHNAAHLDHAVKQWDVFCWDVVNEPRMNHVIDDLLPETNTMVEWFRLADQARTKYGRNFLMYYNENQIASFVRLESTFEEYSEIYKGRIQEVLDAGIPLDGIGMQYRFRRHVSPEEAYRRLCYYEEFNLPYQATEFEVKPMTEKDSFSNEQKKQMTAELLTVFFSHPNSTGLWHWSFMDDRKGDKPDALFSFDGQPRPEAEQWIKMMEEDFNTDEIIRSSNKEAVNIRGFKGTYKITYGHGEKAKTTVVTLQEDQNLKLTY